MEFISLILGIVMLFGVYRCTDKSTLEHQIVNDKPFIYGDTEYGCKRTEKQVEIDNLRSKIQDIKKR